MNEAKFNVLVQANRVDDAVRMANDELTRDRSVPNLLMAAYATAAKRDIAGALNLCNEALNKAPDDGAAHLMRARVALNENPVRNADVIADLEALVEQVRSSGLSVRLEVEGSPASVPPGIDLSAYRIVQEALTNVLKHAGPAPTRLVVQGTGQEVVLVVRNVPGSAAPSAAADVAGRSGHGLVGARERALAAGGTLRSCRTQDGGFELVATIPVGEEDR